MKKTSTVYVDAAKEYARAYLTGNNVPMTSPSAETLASLEFLIRQWASLAHRLENAPIVSVQRSFFRPETKRDVQKSILSMMKGEYKAARSPTFQIS